MVYFKLGNSLNINLWTDLWVHGIKKCIHKVRKKNAPSFGLRRVVDFKDVGLMGESQMKVFETKSMKAIMRIKWHELLC